MVSAERSLRSLYQAMVVTSRMLRFERETLLAILGNRFLKRVLLKELIELKLRRSMKKLQLILKSRWISPIRQINGTGHGIHRQKS